MGWLRKVGRKISKKLGKVFGSKLGAVIGAVGLYMLMGPVAKTLTGWASSVFGGAGAAAGTAATAAETAAAAEAAAAAQLATTASTTAAAGSTSLTSAQILAGANPATVAAGTSQGVSLTSTLPAAGAEIAASTGQAAIGAEAALAEQALLAGENASLLAGSGSSVIPQTAAQQATSASSLTQAEQLANATNNMDKANIAISSIDSASVTGSLNVSPTITDSIIQDAIPAIEQQASVVQANIQQPTPSTFDITGGSSQYHGAGADGYRSSISTASTSPTTTLPSSTAIDTSSAAIDTSSAVIDTATVNPDGIIISNPKTNFVATDDIIMDTAMEDTMNQAVVDSQKNLFAKGIDKVKGYFGDDFVGNTVQGVTTGMIMGELQGDYEEPFRSAGVSSQIASEAAQGNYMQQVGSSAMAAAGLPRMPTFQELSQQTLYGTGSPNYLSQFYQPLATPRMG
mgnify:FL=1